MYGFRDACGLGLSICQMDLFFPLSLPDRTPVTRHCCSVLVPSAFPSLKNISNTSKPSGRWCYITPKTYMLGRNGKSTRWRTDLSKSPYVFNSTKIFHYKYCFYSFLIKKKMPWGALNFQAFQIKDFFSCLNYRNVEKQKQILFLL